MAKTIFGELGGRDKRQGDFNTVLNYTCRRKIDDRHLGTTALGLSEAAPQGYIHQSSHKRQAQRLSCRH